MTLNKLEKTDELIEALRELEKLRTDFFVEGVSLERFDEIVEAVRAVDATTVAAIQCHRFNQLYPDALDGYEAERDAYDAAEERLRADIPKEEEL